jgi:two-component system chemotaxis response regulator CheB
MLTEAEKLAVLKLAEELTGSSQSGENRSGSIITNVERRMRECDVPRWADYVRLVDQNPEEKNNLISALTIHTTAWFREGPHFVMFHELLLNIIERREPIRVWCAACSTGEEVYSFALVLEEFRSVHSGFDYSIFGTDIDPISIEAAETAIYDQRSSNFNLERYQHNLLLGSGKTEGLFTLSKAIRSRCHFDVHDLRSSRRHADGPFDVIICRNVLIYFSSVGVKKVVSNVLQNLKPNGHLFLGHSETVSAPDFGMTSRGHSVYLNSKPIGGSVVPFNKFEGTKDKIPKTGSFQLNLSESKASSDAEAGAQKPRILVVDDTAASRQIISKVFLGLGFDCVAVESTDVASREIRTGKYNLMTLDLQIGGMENGGWLQAERNKGMKIPVVIISDIRKDDAQKLMSLLGRSAQEYIEKTDLLHKATEIRDTFRELLRISQGPRGRSPESLRDRPKFRPDVIAIGSSTGGPQTLARLLSRMPSDCPPILVAQHISSKFALAFAERLAAVSNLQLGKMEDGEPLLPGHLYTPLEDYHVAVQEISRSHFALKVSQDDPVNRHRPSVDYLFSSIAKTKLHSMSIILTGMGRDGALRLKELHGRGDFCIAQSQADCIVFGMPREAINLGAAHFVGDAEEIRSLILEACQLETKSSIRVG